MIDRLIEISETTLHKIYSECAKITTYDAYYKNGSDESEVQRVIYMKFLAYLYDRLTWFSDVFVKSVVKIETLMKEFEIEKNKIVNPKRLENINNFLALADSLIPVFDELKMLNSEDTPKNQLDPEVAKLNEKPVRERIYPILNLLTEIRFFLKERKYMGRS